MTNAEFFEATTKLAIFEYNCDRKQFTQIFGVKMGIHFWKKFTGLNRSILSLWGILDYQNRTILVDYINSEHDENNY